MSQGLEYIYELLPDNDTGQITPENLRNCFDETFDKIDGAVKYTTSTISNPSEGFNYVLLFNEVGKTRRMLAGDLGKNVANSKPTSVQGAGLNLGDNWEVQTNGFKIYVKGLADKSNDSTFSKIPVQNEQGEQAISNGKEILKHLPNILNEAEKTAWKTAMNGGLSTGTKSVFLINPPLIKKDGIRYVTLLGANLNMLLGFTLEIVTSDSTNSNYTVVATIPQNQVQLYDGGINLIFWYDFSSIPNGDYKIRIDDGVSQLVTSVQFNITDNVEQYDLSNTTWQVWTKDNVDFKNGFEPVLSSNQVSVTSNLVSIDGTGIMPVAVISSALMPLSDDFMIECSVWLDNKQAKSSYIGITFNDNISNAQNISAGAELNWIINNNNSGFKTIQGDAVKKGKTHSNSNRMIIIKKGEILTTILYTPEDVVYNIQTINSQSGNVRLKLLRNNDATHDGSSNNRNEINLNLQIISAYKLN